MLLTAANSETLPFYLKNTAILPRIHCHFT